MDCLPDYEEYKKKPEPLLRHIFAHKQDLGIDFQIKKNGQLSRRSVSISGGKPNRVLAWGAAIFNSISQNPPPDFKHVPLHSRLEKNRLEREHIFTSYIILFHLIAHIHYIIVALIFFFLLSPFQHRESSDFALLIYCFTRHYAEN